MARDQPAPLKTARSIVCTARRLLPALLVVITALLTACTDRSPSTLAAEDDFADLSPRLATWQAEQLTAAITAAGKMVAASTQYLERLADDASTAADRTAWQQHWSDAHERYLSATLLVEPGARLRAQTDSWPLQPGFIDSLPAYPDSGIITDTTLALTSTMLRQQHHITDEEETATGFHVLEYYAFERPEVDLTDSAAHGARRRQMILLTSELLQMDLLKLEQNLTNGAMGIAGITSSEILLSRLHSRLKLIFSEYNQLGSHSRYSGRAAHNIKVQLEAIRSLMDPPVHLDQVLGRLDPDITGSFSQTLAEAIQLLSQPDTINSEQESRLLLLISALSHQLDDLLRQLS